MNKTIHCIESLLIMTWLQEPQEIGSGYGFFTGRVANNTQVCAVII